MGRTRSSRSAGLTPLTARTSCRDWQLWVSPMTRWHAGKWLDSDVFKAVNNPLQLNKNQAFFHSGQNCVCGAHLGVQGAWSVRETVVPLHTLSPPPANGPVMWLLHITANVHIPIILADTCAEYTVMVNEAHRFHNLTPSGEGAGLPAAVCSLPSQESTSLFCWHFSAGLK